MVNVSEYTNFIVMCPKLCIAVFTNSGETSSSLPQLAAAAVEQTNVWSQYKLILVVVRMQTSNCTTYYGCKKNNESNLILLPEMNRINKQSWPHFHVYQCSHSLCKKKIWIITVTCIHMLLKVIAKNICIEAHTFLWVSASISVKKYFFHSKM